MIPISVDKVFNSLADAGGLAGRRPLHLAIGMFDGVHLGHRAVIEAATRSARRSGGAAAARGGTARLGSARLGSAAGAHLSVSFRLAEAGSAETCSSAMFSAASAAAAHTAARMPTFKPWLKPGGAMG
jgi:hypothetical protein